MVSNGPVLRPDRPLPGRTYEYLQVPVASFGDGIVIRRVDPGPADVVIGGKATDRSKSSNLIFFRWS
jgi:hypothetical protein